jgi:integrase
MVLLAVSTGLRCCDIVALRLDQIDWRRDEIRLVQAKTSQPLVLPLSAWAGNAVAEWILHGRPDCDALEVFVRLTAPFVKLGKSTGSTLMRRRLTRAGIDHVAHDGKSFHACGAPQEQRSSSSRGPACRWPRRSWAMPASIPPAATSLWPASRSASAACR